MLSASLADKDIEYKFNSQRPPLEKFVRAKPCFILGFFEVINNELIERPVTKAIIFLSPSAGCLESKMKLDN